MKQKIKKFFSLLGPGFITGASDDDPSGIATYSQTGAQFGYNQTWVALFSFPFMVVIQEMCGRIGMVTGKGLAAVIKQHYSRRILYGAIFLLFLANTINIGADLGAMASAGQLLLGLPFVFWLLLITAVTLFLEIFISYPTYAKILKYLTLSLFAYVIAAFVVQQDWSKVAYTTFIPTFSFSKEYMLNIVALLGTTISPYLFFWQADEEVEEEIAGNKIGRSGVPKINKGDIRNMRMDTMLGMLFSNLIMFFIIVTTASTLGAAGITEIETASDAAAALQPLAGNLAYLLFAAGIIGTGLLAVPILAGSASYAVSETFDLKTGLGKKPRQAKAFYAIIAIATIIGLLVNFSPVPPFKMLYYTAVFNGIAAPPLMVLIMLTGNNKKIMGDYINSKASNLLGWIITAVMFCAAVALLVTLI